MDGQQTDSAPPAARPRLHPEHQGAGLLLPFDLSPSLFLLMELVVETFEVDAKTFDLAVISVIQARTGGTAVRAWTPRAWAGLARPQTAPH